MKSQDGNFHSITINNNGSLTSHKIYPPRFKTLKYPFSAIEAYRKLANGEYTNGENAGIYEFYSSEQCVIDAGNIVRLNVAGFPRTVVVGNIIELTNNSPVGTYGTFSAYNTTINQIYNGHDSNWYMHTSDGVFKLAVGSTVNRPTGVWDGFIYYDTTLSVYVTWNGTTWI